LEEQVIKLQSVLVVSHVGFHLLTIQLMEIIHHLIPAQQAVHHHMNQLAAAVEEVLEAAAHPEDLAEAQENTLTLEEVVTRLP
jgi:hypothetical protein